MWWWLATLALADDDPVARWSALMDAEDYLAAATLAAERAEVTEGDDQLEWSLLVCTSQARTERYQTALACAERMLAHPEVTDPYDAARMQTIRAQMRYRLGAPQDAVAPAREALALSLRVDPPAPSLTATMHTGLAEVLEAIGALREAEAELEAALTFREHQSPIQQAQTLAALSSVRSSQGRHQDALAPLEEALSLQSGAGGPDAINTLLLRNNLAALRRQLGDPVGALEEYQAVRAGLTDKLPPGHPYLAGIANNLAMVQRQLADNEVAVATLQEALTLWEQALGPDHPNVASTLTNLAAAHRALGDDGRALAQLQRAAAIMQTTAPEHPNTAAVLLNVAQSQMLAGDLDAAEATADEAIGCLAQVEPTHESWGDVEVLRGQLALSRGDTDTALTHLEEADGIWLTLGGAHHPSRIDTLLARARVHLARGDGQQALAQTEEALDILRHLFPTVPIERLRSELVAIAALQLLGDEAGARERARGAWTLAANGLADQARLSSHLGWRRAMAHARLLRSALVETESEPVASWQVTLDYRHLQHLSTLWGRELAAAEASPEVARLVLRLHAAREAWSGAVWSPRPAETPRAEHDAHLEELRSRVYRLEREVAEHAKALFPLAEAPDQATLCAALAPDEVLVDYTVNAWEIGLAPAAPTVDAFVLVGGDCQDGPRRLPLGPLAPHQAQLDHYRALLAHPTTLSPRVDQAGAPLRAWLWDPVVELVGSARRVWLSSEGTLASLAFGTLPTPDGRYLVEDYEWAYLESPLDLVAPTPVGGGTTRVLSVGGIEYGAEAETEGQRSISPCDMHFPSLPATVEEARQVAALWEERGAQVELLTGVSATESSVRRAASEARVLQLATHGFFLHQACPEHPRDAGAPWASGVVLAQVEGTRDDGLWTSAEVSGLDLRKSELVVLSACETGLGEPSALGVLGLRRAFAAAGARSLVMSLWAVPDAETRDLMVGLHQRLSRQRRLDVPSALRQTQLEALARARERYGEGRPGSWGAFVVSGR